MKSDFLKKKERITQITNVIGDSNINSAEMKKGYIKEYQDNFIPTNQIIQMKWTKSNKDKLSKLIQGEIKKLIRR